MLEDGNMSEGMIITVICSLCALLLIFALCNSGEVKEDEVPGDGYKPYYSGITYHNKMEQILDSYDRKHASDLNDQYHRDIERVKNKEGGRIHTSYKDQKALEKALRKDDSSVLGNLVFIALVIACVYFIF